MADYSVSRDNRHAGKNAINGAPLHTRGREIFLYKGVNMWVDFTAIQLLEMESVKLESALESDLGFEGAVSGFAWNLAQLRYDLRVASEWESVDMFLQGFARFLIIVDSIIALRKKGTQCEESYKIIREMNRIFLNDFWGGA